MDRGCAQYAGPLARRRDQRRPLQSARPWRPSSRRSRRPASTRSGASATWSATAPSPTPARRWCASAARSAWSATTTSRCSARSTSRPSRRRRRRRSTGRASDASAETLEFLARALAGARATTASASSTPPRATRSGSTCSRSTRPKPASTPRSERIGLIGHSHVALFFTRPDGDRGAATPHGAQASDGALLDLDEGDWLLNPGSVGQPRDGDPRAAWLELDTDEWTARYHRVPYDIDAAGAAILEAGLPDGARRAAPDRPLSRE